MEEIYKVIKNYEASDSEDWMHWKAQTIVSYHKTSAGAHTKIAHLIENGIRDRKLQLSNPDLDEREMWAIDQEITYMSRNMVEFENVPNESGGHSFPLFEVIPVYLED